MNHPLFSIALLFACTATITACSDNNDDPTLVGGSTGATDSNYTEIVLNASAGGFGAAADSPQNQGVYFNLDTGETVDLSDDEALLSTAWQLGFKRLNTVFNGGNAGPGQIESAVIADQEHYYNNGEADNNVFLNAVAADEIATLEQAELAGASFVSDTPAPVIASDGGADSWWRYDPATHTLAAMSDNWSIIRAADGDSFAKLHVIAIDTVARDVSVELFIQAVAQSSFSLTPTVWTADIDPAGGALCYDIDSAAETDCDSDASAWDLRLEINADGREWTLWTNGGAHGEGSAGAALTGLSNDVIGNYAGDTQVPGFFADHCSNAVKDKPWYAYNLSAQHKIWPNYRVYAVDTGSSLYKIQLSSYYHPDTGTSGYITLRYAPLTDQ